MPGHTGLDGGLAAAVVVIIHVVGIILVHILFYIHLHDLGEAVEDTPIQVLHEAPQEVEADLVQALVDINHNITKTLYFYY
jgi:hypothetical protein